MCVRQRPEAEEFCRCIRPRLVGSLSLYCGDPQVAEDAVQDALAKVWARWEHVSELPSPEAWTFRVAFNEARSWYRSARRSRRRERQAASGEVAPSADLVEVLAVRRAVSGLPGRQAQALVLRYFEDLSVADTAAVMDCAEGTVKALTNRAIRRLQDDPLLADLEISEVGHVG